MEDRKRSKNVALIAKALDWYTNNKVRIYVHVAGFFLFTIQSDRQRIKVACNN
jgi:hypothetical protein